MDATLTHRRRTDNIDTGHVLMFTEDPDSNDHYGPHVWTLRTELPHVVDCPELLAFAREYIREEYAVRVDEEGMPGDDDIRGTDWLNPTDIVDGAALWEDDAFVSALWQALEPTGYRTDDGAVVLDWRGVELDYHYED